MNYTNKEKQIIINKYYEGIPASTIAREYNLSRSTIYNWINDFKKVPISEMNISKNQLRKDNVEFERLERENSIFNYVLRGIKLSNNEKLKFASSLDDVFPIHTICRVLDLHRATYYHNKYRKPKITIIELDDEIYKPVIKKIFKNSKGRLGGRKIRKLMIKDGYTISEKRIIRLMREMDLVVNQKSDDYNDAHKRKYFYKPNIISKLDSNTTLNMIWVSDITYIKINSVHYYLHVIIDLYSRFIIDYALENNMESTIMVELFKRAYTKRKNPKNLVFHSDQGGQYKSKIFKKTLKAHNITQSFSKTGCPYDNAVCESTFASLKKEEIYRFIYKDFDELEAAIDEYIYYFNFSRPHASLNYVTPNEFENTTK